MGITKYFLAEDCSVRKMGCHWIILSAKHDRYSCVAHDELVTIGPRLQGWRDPDFEVFKPVCLGESTCFAENRLIESLVSKEIITSNPAHGKPFAEFEYPAPVTEIEGSGNIASTSRSFLRTVRFLTACAKAHWYLKTQSLAHTLATIESRRRTVASKDATHAQALVSAFKSLRPFYPRPYVCLFDSLALLEFLAGYRYFPRLVFGVVADPFEAHCWLQNGTTLLNDHLERVSRYKPILSV
ncbi:MAG TPA: lasso peptide biosynthesis B2 protein [Steroidobacteraceae bacterium]|jgi:hypothetical protein|nr:lasso peptide biosynthesis B2 protein [Steroidobacteraceae bacterium]